MSRQMRYILAGLVGSIIVLWVMVAVARNAYFTPRSERQDRIEELTTNIANRTSVNRMQLRREIQSIADRTLGSDRETADHELRSHLNRIAEQLGIEGASVGTAAASVELSPARTLFSRRGLQGEMRDQVDLIELEGWINAQGTLEQVLSLIDCIEAAPWLKRLDQVKLTAKDSGKNCSVSIRLTTLLVPGFAPTAPIEVQQYDRKRLARFAGLLESNPFALPEPKPQPPVQVAETTPPEPQKPPEFPYSSWSLTGTAIGPDGVEAWLRQPSTGKTRRLLVGDSIGKAILLAAEGENARFELHQRQFLVSIGTTLDDRVPVSP